MRSQQHCSLPSTHSRTQGQGILLFCVSFAANAPSWKPGDTNSHLSWPWKELKPTFGVSHLLLVQICFYGEKEAPLPPLQVKSSGWKLCCRGPGKQRALLMKAWRRQFLSFSPSWQSHLCLGTGGCHLLWFWCWACLHTLVGDTSQDCPHLYVSLTISSSNLLLIFPLV